ARAVGWRCNPSRRSCRGDANDGLARIPYAAGLVAALPVLEVPRGSRHHRGAGRARPPPRPAFAGGGNPARGAAEADLLREGMSCQSSILIATKTPNAPPRRRVVVPSTGAAR